MLNLFQLLHSDCIQIAHDRLKPQQEFILQSFFVPDDADVVSILQGLIEHEKKSIRAAVFVFTEPHIAQALIAAKQRGVEVNIVVDQHYSSNTREKITLLQSHGIPVYVYEKKFSTFHDKFFIFECNFFDKPLVWTGSANITTSGLKRNEENVVVCNFKDFVEKYMQKFNAVWERLKHAKKGIVNYKKPSISMWKLWII